MFEYQGKQYSREQVQAAADSLNMSINSYVEKYGFSEVKTTPQEAGAPVAEVAAPDMDFSLEDGSLEPPKTEITPLQSIKNAISNVGKDFSRVGEFWTGESGTAELAGAAIFETAFGRKTAENLVDKYGKDSWLTQGIGIDEILENIPEAREELEKEETIGIVESIKEGDVAGALSGGLSTIINAFGSAAYGFLTAGTGFFFDYAAENYIDYNEQKAKRKNTNLKDLILANEDETVAPVAIGLVQAKLENIGLKKILGAGTKEVVSSIGKKMSKAVGKNVYDVLRTGFTEAATEIGQETLSKYNQRLSEDGDEINAFKKVVSEDLFTEEMLETGLQGFVGGGGIKATGKSAKKVINSIRTKDESDAINQAVIEASRIRREAELTQDPIVKENLEKAYQATKDKIQQAVEATNNRYFGLSDKKKNQILNLRMKADKAVEDFEKLTESYTNGDITKEAYDLSSKQVKKEFEEQKLKIRGALKEDETIESAVDKSINFGQKLASFLGRDFQVVETTDEFRSLLPEDKAGDADLIGGFYDPGAKKIYINRESAINTFQINVGAHEVLHPILNTQIGDAKSQGEFVNKIKKQLNRAQRAKMDEIMSSISEEKEYNVEYLTKMVDAMTKNELDYDDNLIEKIVKIIKDTINKFKPESFNVDIGFENSEQVLEFLKTYSESAKKGELDQKVKSIIDLTKEETVEDIQTSYIEEREFLDEQLMAGYITDEEYNDRLDALDETEGVEPLERETDEKPTSKFKSVLDAVGSNPEGYDPFNPNIERTINSMVRAKAKRFKTADQRIVDLTNLPGFNLNDFAGSVYLNMLTGKRLKEGGYGPGYLQVFNPNVNDSLYGYINAQLANRMRSVLAEGEITTEKFGVRAEEQVDLYDDAPMFDEFDADNLTEEQIDQGLINPVSLIDEAQQKQTQQEVDSKIDGVNLAQLIFKKTPNLVTKTLSEVFGVRESAIQKASQNLNTSELEATAPILADMAKLLIKILPQGAIVQGKGELAVSEKLIGTGTGISRKILDAFYEKGRRLVSAQEGIGRKGAGLEPFTLKQNITKEQFLNALGINEDGTHNPEIKPKSPQSQTRRAMIDLVGKLMSNTMIRNEMKKRGMSPLAINDLAAGKSSLMFSQVSDESSMVKKKTSNDYLYRQEIDDILQFVEYEKKRFFTKEQLETLPDDFVIRYILDIYEQDSTGLRLRQSTQDDIIQKIVERNNASTDTINKNFLDSRYTKTKEGGKTKYIDVDRNSENVEMATSIGSLLDPLIGGKAQIKDYSGATNSLHVYKDTTLKRKVQNGDLSFGKRDEQGNIQPLSVEEQINSVKSIDQVDQGIKSKRGKRTLSKSREEVKRLNIVKKARAKAGLVDGQKVPDPNKLTSIINKILREGGSLRDVLNAVWEQKKYNAVRRATMKYIMAVQMNYLHNSNEFDFNKRAAFIMTYYSNTSANFKRLSEVSGVGYNMIFEGTKAVQFEHLDPASSMAPYFFRLIMTQKFPTIRYKSAIWDADLSKTVDQTYAKMLTDKGPRYVSYKMGALKQRIQRAIEIGKGVVKIDKKVVEKDAEGNKIEKVVEDFFGKKGRPVFFSKVDSELRNAEQEANMKEQIMGGIIKNLTGIGVNERVSQSTAKIMAANRNKKWRLLSPSADDFVGLLYSTLGKGKVGDAQLKFYKKTLIDPFNRANHAMDAARQKISRDFKDLNKEYEVVKKSLNKKAGYKDYTNDQAIRVFLYKKAGASNASLSINEADEKALLALVNSNPEFKQYAEYLMEITELDNSWIEPSPNWVVGTVFDDVNSIIDRLKRAEYLAEWKENVDAIFSENNRNKLEGYFGEDYRRALDDMLYRMEKGKAIPEKMNKEMNRFQQWLTGSVAVTMFLNRRSAVLQTISNINYMNWSDNNPIAAAKAFANTNQFAKDFALIFNSDYLKQRRGGLKTEVEAAVLANELRKGGVEGMRGAINKILKAGFTLTQLGDSFAISFGGASFYRNRKNSYLKQGLTEEEAREQAFLDFREISEESQQSARPDRLSMQQTNSIGRVFLAFQNTPMQYYRLIAKAIMDIKNGRGDLKTNISKIAYYGIAQNLMFTAMQQALFAFLFDDPEDEEEQETKDEKVLRTINNSIDTLIRGTGYYGAVISTIKNVILEFVKQEKKGFKADHAYTMIQALNLSAPIGIKARTLYQGAYQNYKYNKEIIDDLGYDIDNPGYDIVASLTSFGVNVPLDKVIQMTRGIKEASDKDNEAWQRIALALGWSTWNLGMPNEKIEKAKEINTKRKKAEALEKRRKKKKAKSESSFFGEGESTFGDGDSMFGEGGFKF